MGERYDSGGDQCISCVDGETSDGGSDETCDPCLNGEYSNADTSFVCTPCPAGNFSASPTGSCDACAAGTYQPLTGPAIELYGLRAGELLVFHRF